jgi:hypothetical protein
VSDDEEGKQEKLPTDEELPTSADGDETGKEQQADDYVVDLGGSYVHYHRSLDGKMRSREYLAEELVSDEALSDEDLQKVERVKTVDLDAILAIQDADKGAVRAPAKRAGIEELPSPSALSAVLKLYFSKPELEGFVAHRKAGLAEAPGGAS